MKKTKRGTKAGQRKKAKDAEMKRKLDEELKADDENWFSEALHEVPDRHGRGDDTADFHLRGVDMDEKLMASIALWLPSLGNFASVNRCSNASVLCCIERLTYEFWKSNFDVQWLVVETDTCLLTYPELRLQRVLPPRTRTRPRTRWWYNVQLYLEAFCQRYAQRHGTAPTLRVIFELCYNQSVCKSRRCRELFPEFFEETFWPEFHTLLHTELHEALFRDVNFVRSRDLGCVNLGTSVEEVLETLLCMMQHDVYCLCETDGPEGCRMQMVS